MMRRKKTDLVFPWLILILSGCVTARPHTVTKTEKLTPVVVENLTTTSESNSIEEDPLTESEILEETDELSKIDESDSASEPAEEAKPVKAESTKVALEAIPVDMNEYVQKWIDYFSNKDHARFQRFLNQGSQYREVVENLLDENGLPAELYYLAMIESGYSPRATSVAKAAGVWQFIPATGKRYGLEVNHFNDERRDPIRATEAAAKYLKDLYNVFGSWHLAIAAYNAGEFRIMGSVIRGKSRNFWSLVKSRVLPEETANYIPKFIAAMTIGENPKQYGFDDPQAEKYPNLEAIEVPSPVRLPDIAQAFNVSLEELQRVNPNLRRDMTPPYAKNYEIWIPADKIQNSQKAQLQLAQLRITKPLRLNLPTVSEQPRNYHIVKSGESLRLIAQKYKVSPHYLRRLNHLASNKVIAGSKLRITAKSYHPKKITRYYVKRGDNLNIIAKRFGISVRKLRTMNSIRGNKIAVGQVIRVTSEGT